MSTNQEFRPFHESIVEELNEASSISAVAVRALGRLIKKTAIPCGHDVIIAAWNSTGAADNCSVRASILKQKRQVERRHEVRQDLIAILTELSRRREDISDSLTLYDLGIGVVESTASGDFVNLRGRVEDKFKIRIPRERIPSASQLPEVTVGSIVKLVCELLEQKEVAGREAVAA